MSLKRLYKTEIDTSEKLKAQIINSAVQNKPAQEFSKAYLNYMYGHNKF